MHRVVKSSLQQHQKKRVKTSFIGKIEKIREKCSDALEFDVDNLLGPNEEIGWALPKGFMDHARVVSS